MIKNLKITAKVFLIISFILMLTGSIKPVLGYVVLDRGIDESTYYYYGDVNLDGKVTSEDARIVLRATVGLEKLSNNQIILADISRNGKIQADDARAALRTSVGLEKAKQSNIKREKETGVTISFPRLTSTVSIGTKINLSATVTPSNTTFKTVKWASSNTNVAEINSNGQVTVKGKGNAIISATTTNGHQARVVIYVNNASNSFWWPIGADASGNPYSTRISSQFGYRTIDGKTSFHEAIDISLPKGTPVIATRDGTVVATVDGFGDGALNAAYYNRANYIIIEHSDGTRSKYWHLQKGLLVKNGQTVKQGQVIAYSGNSGYTQGPHLHFGITDAAGKVVDPLTYVDNNKPYPVSVNIAK